MKFFQRILIGVLGLCMVFPGHFVLAATDITFEGTVISGESISISAPFGGTISALSLRAGSKVAVGTTIATIETTKVYASEGGTISGVFAQAGDSVEDIVSRYAAVLYIAPERKYTITADVEKAYDSAETRYVNIGETVFIACTADGAHTAKGVITSVNGTTYTVETTSGELLMDETVSLYRTEGMDTKSRIGRGSVSRTAEIAVGGSGSILYMHVRDGEKVTRGQLLFETVTGSFDGLYALSNEIVSDVDGIVASVDVAAGSSVSKGTTLMSVYPNSALQIEVLIPEYDLLSIAEGDRVKIGFNWDEGSEQMYEGTVSMISHMSQDTNGEVAYKGYIDFAPGADVRLGMTVVVYAFGTDEGQGTEKETREAPLDGNRPSEEMTQAPMGIP